MTASSGWIRERLRGVAAGLLTPFDERSNVAHEKLAANAQELYEAGIRTFLATANISEYHSLSRNERTETTATSVEALPSDACVLAGVGGNTTDATDLIEAYDRIGVDAMMIMPPDHTYRHEQGLLEYYRQLAAAAEAPLVPYVRGVDPSVEYLVELSRLENVVGIKYALPDVVKLGHAVECGSGNVVWVNGMAEPFAVATWAEGCEGFSAGVSNFRPEVGLALFEALSEGDWERARRIRNVCLPFQRFREETGANNAIPGAMSVPAVKNGLDLAGLHGGSVRPPIRPLEENETRRVEELYERLEADIERVVDP